MNSRCPICGRGSCHHPPLPSARVVKELLGQIDVGAYLVSHHDNWGDERFPWRVLSPPDEQGFREILDEHAQYRTAVQDAYRRDQQRSKKG